MTNRYCILGIALYALIKTAPAQERDLIPAVPADSFQTSRLMPYGPTDADYEQEKLSESSPFDQTNPIKLFLVLLISGYQNTFSALDGSTCQFRPSCSHFSAQSIKQYGVFIGTLMTSDRLLRCNPFTNGKYQKAPDHYHNLDPAENHTL